PQLPVALEERAEVFDARHRNGAMSPLGQAPDRPRARGGHAFERLHQRRARLGLAVRTDRLESQRVPQRSERLLGIAGRQPPLPELRVRPPEPLIDLFDEFGRHRIGLYHCEQYFRPLQLYWTLD